MIPALRLAVGVSALSMTAALHAATPITLPLGDLGLHSGPELALPVPPPPQASKPDVTQMRLVIKYQPRGCSGDDGRRSLTERRQATTPADPWATKPVWSRWG